uniref:Uncharacterized protein n=1 Tax=uncultured Alphaproteobacteria bacterium TaxID=91750 RepID=A0A6M4NMF6_9PROT|nr:hypothetical protein PlAlph_1610 [uncultured Alphaproteobacteria bacterium]
MDDDIFPESKEDKENKEDSNMDWKKSGIDKHERLTLKINVKEANLYNADEKRDTKPRAKVRTPTEVPKGFKKISKKIRESFDDEEDDDEYILVPVFMDKEMSSLEKALTPDERKQLQQMESPVAEDIHLRQTVERDMQLQRAEEVTKKAGLDVDRKITEQQRNKTQTVEAKDLAKENLKKSKDKDVLNLKESKTEKPAKGLPKIKNAEEKEVRKAIDDAEKDKKSVKKNLEKQQQEKNETSAVTKEKSADEKQKSAEIQKTEEFKKEEQRTTEEKQTLDEKTAREIILEKSGRIAKKEQEKQVRQGEEAQEQEVERGAREHDEYENRQYQNQHVFQRSGRSR